jgi:hypothetical protein
MVGNRRRSLGCVGLPDISNNVGSVKLLSKTLLRSLLRVVLFVCIDDHGSLAIFRSASVRPRHPFDPYFDHDYLCELPFPQIAEAHREPY